MKKYRKFFPTTLRREIAERLRDGEMIRALAKEFETSAYRIRKIRDGAGIPTLRCRGLTLSMRQRIASDPRSAAVVAAECGISLGTALRLQRAFRKKHGQPDLYELALQLVRGVLEKSFGGSFPNPVEGDGAFVAGLLAASRASVPEFEFQSQATLDAFAASIAGAVRQLRVQQGHAAAWLN